MNKISVTMRERKPPVAAKKIPASQKEKQGM
jgi:hypothetical protein